MPAALGFALGTLFRISLDRNSNLDHGDPEKLLFSMTRFFNFLH